MANSNGHYVDISSNTQVFKLYNKKGRALRILCLIFSILFLLGGGAMVYYYALLNSMNFEDFTAPSSDKSDSVSATVSAEADHFDNTSEVSIDPLMQQQLGGDMRSTTRSGIPGLGNVMLIEGINSLRVVGQAHEVCHGPRLHHRHHSPVY